MQQQMREMQSQIQENNIMRQEVQGLFDGGLIEYSQDGKILVVNDRSEQEQVSRRSTE